MKLYFITYELRNKNKDYSEFYETIKKSGIDCCQCLTNVWLVYSDSLSSDIYNNLRELIEDTDNVLLGEIEFRKLAGWVSSDTLEFLNKYKV